MFKEALLVQMMNMKIYNAKTTFSGYVLGFPTSGQLVGVPENQKYTAVTHKGEMMSLKGKTCLGTKSFPDKFNRSKFYSLSYYEWKPEEQPVEEVGLFSPDNKSHIERMLQMRDELIAQGVIKKT